MDLEEIGEVAVKFKTEKVRKLKGEIEEEYTARAKAQASKKLANRGKGPFTLLQKLFRGHVSLPVAQFCWLVKHRGLAEFELVHDLHYSKRDSSCPSCQMSAEGQARADS